MPEQVRQRLASIDVFRALTMFLMIFVNDLWTLENVPVWLEHVPAEADGMGFSDVIFPAFLFIVGLSIPFAQERRGTHRLVLFRHILLRSLALLVMGFFHVNMQHYSAASLLPEPVWKIVVTAGFFLIWLDYPKERKQNWLQLAGVLLLALMAMLYKGDAPAGGLVWMRPYWWGILGLIGWAFLSCASIFLLSGEKLAVLTLSFLFFVFFNASMQLDRPDLLDPLRNLADSLKLGNGAHASLVMAGVVTSVVYRKLQEKPVQLAAALIAMAALLFLSGFGTRPWWGISKIQATPSWACICAGISVLVFGMLIWLVDRKGKEKWFNILKPAGTSTLTCYLLPYLHLAIFISLMDLHLSLFLRTGMIGIFKSLLFALLIILVTGWLEKRRIRLRI